jgi:hypothetical protein
LKTPLQPLVSRPIQNELDTSTLWKWRKINAAEFISTGRRWPGEFPSPFCR